MEKEKFYTTVEQEASAEFEEKKSVFIGYAKPIKTEEEAQAFIKEKKKIHADATHNVFAYILKGGAVARYSDDNEPQGTAGMPVLDTIRKSGAEDVCIVVTRYFGGTLLGAGGLVRAYSHAAKIALDAAHVITYEKYDVFRLCCTYSEYQKYLPLIGQVHAITDQTDFAADVTLTLAIHQQRADAFCRGIAEISAGKTAVEKIGERYDYQ